MMKIKASLTKTVMIIVLAPIILISALILGINIKNDKDNVEQRYPPVTHITYEPVLIVDLSRKWLIKDQSVKKEMRETTITITVYPKDSKKNIKNISYNILDSTVAGDIELDDNLEAKIIIDENDLSPGKYTIEFIMNSVDFKPKNKKLQFNVSYPIYVAWTTDWEGLNTPLSTMTQAMVEMEQISDENDLPITHMYNPRYLLPTYDQTKSSTYTNWIRDRTVNGDDDLGIHLHMFWDMVETAGVEAIKEPSYYNDHQEGYAIASALYSYEDYKQITKWAIQQFEANDLPTPTSFRAGGWMADLHNIKAVQDAGILIDSTGKTKSSTGKIFPDNWDLDILCGPHYISETNKNDCNKSDNSKLQIMEIPNNGGDSYRLTVDELIERFDQNYTNHLPLEKPRTVIYLSHPEYGHTTEFPKISKTFKHISKFKAENDDGPVIYSTLSQIKDSWKDNKWTDMKY